MTVAVLYARPTGARPLDFTATDASDVTVTDVRTATAALDVLASSAFDCLVTHQDLDSGTGLEVLAGAHEERPDVPVVLCSAEPDGELASEATRYGVAAYHVCSSDERVENRLVSLLDEAATDAPAIVSDGAAATHGSAFATIADTISDAVVTIDTDSTITFMNAALAELTGYDREELVGESFTTVMPERYHDSHVAGLAQYAETGDRTVNWDYLEFELEHSDGHEIPVTVSFSEYERDGDLFVTGVIRDVTGRESQARALQELHDIAADPEPTTIEKIRQVLDDHRQRLGLDVAFLTRIDDGTEHLVATVGDHPLIQEGYEYPLEDTYCQHTIADEDPVIVTDAAEATALDESVYETTGAACYVGQTVTVGEELYGTLCFAADAGTDREFDDADVAFLELLADWVGYELQQADQRERLREERQRVETILERVDDAFFALDDEWRFTYFNRRAEEVLGRSAEAVMGESIWEVFEAAVGSTFDEQYHEAMATQQPVTFEEYYPPLEKWFQVSAYPSDDGLSVYFSDVTDRRSYTRSLTELHERTQQLATDATPTAVAETVLDAAADVLDCSLGTVRRYDPDAGTLRPVATSADADDLLGPRPVYEDTDWGPMAALDRGERVVYDDPAARAAESAVGPEPESIEDIETVMYVPIGTDTVLSLGTTDNDGFDEPTRSLAELLAAHADLAFERVERERDLRTYETVLESLQGMVYALDTEEHLTLVTDPLAAWLGYDRGQLVGAHPGVVMDDAEVERFRDELGQLRENDERSVTLETDLTAADGRRLPAEIEISTAYANDGFEGTIGVVRDLSELQETREQLETERDRFSYLFDNIPDAAVDVVFEADMPVVEATNEAFEDVFGYDGEEALGEPLSEHLVPEALSPGDSDSYEAIAGMEQWSGEIRREAADGLRYFLFRGVPYREADGTRHGFGIYTDITERRQRARRLQVLTRVLRHNLRNDLAILLGYAEMLREDIEDDRLRSVAESVCDRIHEVSDLSEEVRAVQETLGDTRTPTRRVEAAEYVRTLVEESRDVTPDASVGVDVPAGLSLAVDERLDLVIQNLVENALEYAGEDPTVELTARADGETLVLTVADDGPGIPDLEWDVVTGQTEITQLSHGSGLGLWTVKWVADSYGGQLRRVETDLGGAAVELRLPGLVD